jgi:Domain of unknown function (DUF4178)
VSHAPSLSGRCPNCGSALTFQLGSSRLAVCEYCKAAVARAGQDLSVVGTMADLIPTGSRLALGQTGRTSGLGFTLLGQVQLEWEGGVWDEWYASFSDGRWGWVSEAQGRYYVLFRVGPRPLPPRERARPGERLFLKGLGEFVIADVKDARLATCRGELPDEVTPGEVAHSVDLDGKGGAFATIDYGSAPDDPVQLFVGTVATLAQLGLGAAPQAAPAQTPKAGDRLSCPNCNGSVELKLPGETRRVTCPFCNALLDTSQGALRLIEVLEKLKRRPPIPLGTRGTLRGEAVLPVGWMRRSCVVDGDTYDWEEVLLHVSASGAFWWLVVSDGHWSLARPISAAEVEDGWNARYQGRTFKRFGDVEGTVEEVLGEFNWEVKRGDTARLVDYVAPPDGLSLEQTTDEVNWSLCTHLEADEVTQGFALERPLPPAVGVGAFQPWPHAALLRELTRWVAVGMGVTVAVFLALLVMDRQAVLVDRDFTPLELTVDAPEPGEEAPPGPTHSFLSEDFTVHERGPVQVQLSANVDNAWAFASGALVQQETGELSPFDLEVASWSGVDDGERWTEGSREGEAELGTAGPGTYLLRADLQWDPRLPRAPGMHLTVRQGGVSFWQFLAAMLALCLPLLLLVSRNRFEARRWENSNLVGAGSAASAGSASAGGGEDD